MNGQVEVVIGRATLNEPRYALSPLLPFRCPIDWTATDWTRTTPPPVVVVVARVCVEEEAAPEEEDGGDESLVA